MSASDQILSSRMMQKNHCFLFNFRKSSYLISILLISQSTAQACTAVPCIRMTSYVACREVRCTNSIAHHLFFNSVYILSCFVYRNCIEIWENVTCRWLFTRTVRYPASRFDFKLGYLFCSPVAIDLETSSYYCAWVCGGFILFVSFAILLPKITNVNGVMHIIISCPPMVIDNDVTTVFVG